MTRTVFIREDQELTPEQIAMLDAAEERPITYDEDCPELTPKTEAAFLRAVAERNARLREASRRTAQA